MSTWFHAMPASVRAQIGDISLNERDAPEAGLQAAHIFTTERDELERLLTDLRTLIDSAGFVWVSWPKRAAKVPTDITEDAIRENRRCDPRNLPADGLGRREGLRRRRHLVRPQTDDPERAAQKMNPSDSRGS